MLVPHPAPITGKSYIERFPLECAQFFALNDRRLQGFQRCFYLEFDFVRNTPELRALLSWKLAETLKLECKKAGFAGQISCAGVF